MPKLNFFIDADDNLTRLTLRNTQPDTMQWLSMSFIFDNPAWDNLSKVVYLQKDSEKYAIEMMDNAVPASSEFGLSAGTWQMGIVGYANDADGNLTTRARTSSIKFRVDSTWTADGDPMESQIPSMGEQLYAKVCAVRDEIFVDLENYFTKTESDERYIKKGEIPSYDDTYTKEESDARFAVIDHTHTEVNGHTVESDVPEDAKFTDTVYDDTEIKAEVAGKQATLVAGENITIDGVTISATDTVYDDTEIKAEVAGKQDALTAGDGISIVDGVISVSFEQAEGSDF